MKFKAWIFLLLCNLFWYGNMIVGKLVTNYLPPITTMAITAFLGVLATIPFLIIVPLVFSELTSAPILGIIFIGVFSSFLSF
ncbi:hypothetical protein [Bacillus cereus]|uniref:hypothetical protein n=1 Tax=Bacillus cereus TaxID=1396 RepID=UPI0018792D95|nr:hypothetical protein [Bacillus cereus]MBE7099810.1 hypothetical protein [Bacillus cereus]